jgi:CxxC-x17-CxxC domain-containing protein
MNNNEITFFAKTNFRNQDRVFGIKTDDRRRHMYIIGKTGMGKTNLLENMVIQDIRNGHGICYIDPHGDTAEKLLKSVPAERINDVIYFNPADQAYPIAFNVMESIDPEYRHLVASGLVGVFKKIWADSWGPRLEYILRNAIMALLEYPGSTLLGVTRILVDKKYRERIVERITDPVIRQFWVDEFPKWSDKVLQEVVSPIQNKVGQFLSNSLIRNIVGQAQSSFDVRKVMDERKILIMNLSKGRIGEDASALLGAMMITKIQLAAMGRVDMNEDDRKDFYLYVDEFQNFATESFANILSEARKYRLNLILANQYIEQIDEVVRNAIFGNAGTLISFRVGATDAEFLEKEFAPIFTQTDIVNLQKFNIYLKLMIDGIAGDAFSATTLPPVYIEDTRENEDKIIQASREHYTCAKLVVEENIARWSGMVLPNRPEPQQYQPRNFVEEQDQQQASQQFYNAEPQIQAQPEQPQFQQQTQPQQPQFQPQAQPQIQTQPEPQVQPQYITPEPPKSQPQQTAHVEQAKPENGMTAFQAQMQASAAKEEFDPYAPVEPAEEPKPAQPDRPMYDTLCETCGLEIKVPFKPDGKRPTFCKDCLKDFQRINAKAKLGQERKAQRQTEMKSKSVEVESLKNQEKPKKHIEHKAYIPKERPMSLSQMQHIAPKKFKADRKRPNVNLDEVRKLIKRKDDEK